MSNQIRNAKTIQSKSRQHAVRHIAGNVYEVVSATSGSRYTVRHSVHGCTCSCNWGQHRNVSDQRSGCSHSIAAMSFVAQAAGAANVSAWGNVADAARQHRQMMEIGDGVVVTVRA